MNKLASVEKNIYFKAEREVMNGRVPHQASMLLRVALMIVGSTLLLGVSPTYSQQAQQDNTQTKKTYTTCERVATNFRECKVCDDKAMTVNCKTLWCTDDGTCEEKKASPPKPNLPPVYKPLLPKSTSQLRIKSAGVPPLSASITLPVKAYGK